MKNLVITVAAMLLCANTYAQSFTLRGTVFDKRTNYSLPGVEVVIKGTTIGTVTNIDGKFELVFPNDTTKQKTIVFLYVGYETQEYLVDTKKNDIKVFMKEEDYEIAAVVVADDMVYHSDEAKVEVAYSTTKTKGYTGSAATLSEVVSVSTKSTAKPKATTKKVSTASEKMAISASHSADNNSIKSGTLTAGEVNDFAKWHLWGDILQNDFKHYNKLWGFYPIRRYIAQLTNEQGMPVSNAQVTLKLKNNVLWQAKTDNTGKAELWLDFFNSQDETSATDLNIIFEYERKTAKITNVTPFEQGINTAQIKTECNERNKVDIFFMIDATGSMQDEMRYLQVELEDIIKKVHKQQSELQLRVGSLVYRDHSDEYLTRKSSLNGDINETLKFLREQSAVGGGDYPEAVDIALEESVANEDWDNDALARILFIVLDAPSHTNPENIARLETQLRLAAKKGVRIVPIACSDISKDGEYLMRTFALATNGTYLFLTDDSGVGNAHIKPTTDKYDVEKLNDAIVRIIKQYTQMPDCDNPKWAQENKDTEPSDKFVPNPYDENAEKDTEKLTVSDIIKVYPNPCSDILKVEIKKSDVKDIYFVDMTGKTLFGFKNPAKDIIEFNVQTLPTGIYFVKAFYKGKWFSEKIIVVKK